jgi:hypothetical protein
MRPICFILDNLPISRFIIQSICKSLFCFDIFTGFRDQGVDSSAVYYAANQASSSRTPPLLHRSTRVSLQPLHPTAWSSELAPFFQSLSRSITPDRGWLLLVNWTWLLTLVFQAFRDVIVGSSLPVSHIRNSLATHSPLPKWTTQSS